jgi:hypothetical protein
MDHRLVFYLKHNVSEIGFCLRLQVVPIQLGPMNRVSPCPGDWILSPSSCGIYSGIKA